MKKIACLFLVFCMAIGLYACSDKPVTSVPTADPTATVAATIVSTEEPTQSPETTSTPDVTEAPATEAPVEKWITADKLNKNES